MQNQLKETAHDMVFDDELRGIPPSNVDLETAARRKLMFWLDFAQGSPTLTEVEQAAPEILKALNYSIGFKRLAEPASELALSLSNQFERLDLGQEWFARILTVFDASNRSEVAPAIHKMALVLVRHFQNSGDPSRIQLYLRDFFKVAFDSEIQRGTTIARSVVALSRADLTEGERIAEAFIVEATQVGDQWLLGLAHSIMSAIRLRQGADLAAFLHAQYSYRLALHCQDSGLQLESLQYIALGTKMQARPRLTMMYLDRADTLAAQLNDRLQQKYLALTRAQCLLSMGDYQSALDLFVRCRKFFVTHGYYAAMALHGHGYALLRLKLYKSASRVLMAAANEWSEIGFPLEEIYVLTALAELYEHLDRLSDGIQALNRALSVAEEISHSCPPGLVAFLQGGVAELSAKLAAQNAKAQ